MKAVCLLAVPMVEPVILMVIVVTLVWAKVVSAKLGNCFMPLNSFIILFCRPLVPIFSLFSFSVGF